MDTIDEIVGYEEPSDDADRLAYEVIGAAIEVHKEMGAGHPEAAYERALCIELTLRKIPFICQAHYSLSYKGHDVGEGRVDLLVGDLLIVEVKPCNELAPVHTAQAVAYLKAMGKKLALLINFNVPRLKHGVKRIAKTN